MDVANLKVLIIDSIGFIIVTNTAMDLGPTLGGGLGSGNPQSFRSCSYGNTKLCLDPIFRKFQRSKKILIENRSCSKHAQKKQEFEHHCSKLCSK